MAYAPHELVIKWRRQVAAINNPDSRYAEALAGCANELELIHHEHNHDGEWVTDGSCPHCDRERGVTVGT